MYYESKKIIQPCKLCSCSRIIGVFCVFAVLISVGSCKLRQPEQPQTNEEVVTISYNQLINDYEVTVQWFPDSFLKSCYGDAVYTLVKKSDTIVFRQRLCVDDVGVIPDYTHCIGKTITLDYKAPSNDAPFTGNVLINFVDVNYDGEMELVTYGDLTYSAHEGEEGNSLDCYPIYVWRLEGDSITRLSGEPFDELAEGPCRVNIYFQRKNHALVMHRYIEYGRSHKSVYYFKNGVLNHVEDVEYQYDYIKDKQNIISKKETKCSD